MFQLLVFFASCWLVPLGVLAATWASIPISGAVLGLGLETVIMGSIVVLLRAPTRFTAVTSSTGFRSLVLLFAVYAFRAALTPSGAPATEVLTLLFVGLLISTTAAVAMTRPDSSRQYLLALGVIGTVLAVGEAFRVARGGLIHEASVFLGANPNVLGRIIGVGFLALVMVNLPERRAAQRRLALVVCAIGVLLSGSLGAIAAVVAAVLVILRSQRQGRVAFTAGVLLGALSILAFFGGPALVTERLAGRTGDWESLWSRFLTSPIFGAGIPTEVDQVGGQAAGSISSTESAHSILLQILSEVGIVGAALFVFTIVWTLRRTTLTGRVLIVAALVDSSVTGYLGAAHTLWAALGVGIGEVIRQRARGVELDQPHVEAVQRLRR